MFYRSLTEDQALRVRRARPVIALAAVAFAIGAIVGANSGPSAAGSLAGRFAGAWAKGDYRAMYAEIDSSSRRTLSATEFASAYAEAMRTATATRLKVVGKPRAADGLEDVPMRVRTRLFGTLALSVRLRIVSDPEGGSAIAWSRSLVFPGMRSGETLSRRTALPPRATLLARDGSVLAEGAATSAGPRSSPLGESASAVIGEVGPIPSSRRAALEAQGVPSDAVVGTSGLEQALDAPLRGTPGGGLRSEERRVGKEGRARWSPYH